MKLSSFVSLPNLLTLVNLFAGCMAVAFLFNYQMELVPYCVLVSLIADFLDGLVARFTKSSTEIGKQLDSLADMVSFGVVPGAIIFHLLFLKLETSDAGYSYKRIYLYAAPAFAITISACLRLAKFNLDHRQNEIFHGLATPGATIFATGILLMVLDNSFGLAAFLLSGKVLYGATALLSILMLADIPMFGFKLKTIGWKGNETRYLFIILSIGLLIAFKFAAVCLIIILYVILSIAQKFSKR